jgi:hypothetical protein
VAGRHACREPALGDREQQLFDDAGVRRGLRFGERLVRLRLAATPELGEDLVCLAGVGGVAEAVFCVLLVSIGVFGAVGSSRVGGGVL